ncbi:hypothetical protein [Thermopetrobacter sp. TC1]|nr:hypothetical protein [Thermopetrobacter sp. TC1]
MVHAPLFYLCCGNAIYRKAGLRGRSELVAYFVEDLLAGEKLLTGRG